MSKPKVFFTSKISPEKVIEMYKILNKDLPGKVAVKVHSGEKGNVNFLRPEFLKPMVDYIKGTVVECNTAYPGARNSTEKHRKLLEEHGWTKTFKFDLLDAEGPDEELSIPDGILIKRNKVGKNLKNYNSCLVLSHFKGHAMGGFGGALKQLSIGFGSTAGKVIQHSGDKTESQAELWGNLCEDKQFKEAMADAAASVVRKFKGNMAFVTMMVNISPNCDCDGKAPKARMKDIGILSSVDPVAIDKACLDLLYSSKDPEKAAVIKQIETHYGAHIIPCAEKLGIGKAEYELVNVD